jgi:protein-S-isoprenylcysteine O-methyltransferase Ste14
VREAPLSLRGLELKVPPVPLVALFAALMWLVARATPFLTVSLPYRYFLASAVAAAGAAVSGLGVLSFRRARTTVNPMTPEASSALVVRGVYRVTRNPMYLGFLLWLVAWAVALANGLATLLPLAFVLYMNQFQIAPEERALQARFGDDFEAYMSRVRRWV